MSIDISKGIKIGVGSQGEVYKMDDLLIKKTKDGKGEVEVLKIIEKHSKLKKYFPIYKSSFIKDRVYYIITDYIDGINLGEFLKEERTIDCYGYLNIFKQLIQGLNMLHKKDIVHRDIKLENIIINNNLEIKYIDMGSSCCVKDTICMMKKRGTPYYLSPELIKLYFEDKFNDGYDNSVDDYKKSDIWALGVTLFSLLYKKKPFDAINTNILYRNILETEPIYHSNCFYLNNILQHMLYKDHNKRYNTDQLLVLINKYQ